MGTNILYLFFFPTVIEPSLDRSTEISILGLALLESPEALQGFGVLTVAKKNWQTVVPKRVMPVVLDC